MYDRHVSYKDSCILDDPFKFSGVQECMQSDYPG